jgi:alkylation response protein AidB-like acyl-CoA dehydrogenase
VPALPTLLLGVLPVTRWGSRDLQQALLADVAAGGTVLTAAIREPSDPMPAAPATTASWTGTVSGVKIGVPYAAAAARILVPASITSGGTGVVIIDPAADGVSLRRTPSSAGGPEYTLRLDDAPVTGILGTAAGGQVVRDLYQLAIAGACCVVDGALSAALALTTTYIGSREQFGRPLSAFQAVSQQIADVYVVARTLHLATLSACWRLETGREAAGDLDVAAYWLAEHAPAALRTCHHLHGGIGMDVSYPLHRYSSLVKDLARFVGGADYRLDVLRPGIIE